jgi:hypothetical protein
VSARPVDRDPDEDARRALAALESADPEERAVAEAAAAAVLTRWRLPMPDLWAAVVAALSRQDRWWRTGRLVASGGQALRPHADTLLGLVAGEGRFVAPYAAAALIGIGDARVVPFVARAIGTPTWWGTGLDLRDLLVPLAPHAGDLLPAVRAALPAGTTDTGAYLAALGGWGPASAPAVPEIVAVLDTADAVHACVALGRIGPPADAAAATLEHLASGRRRPPRRGGSPTPGWHGRQQAAWAYWRITGDAEPALSVLGDAVARGAGHAVLPFLADLGPLASGRAGRVRRLLALPGEWNRVEAAEAWWRITGDPAPAVPALLTAIGPLRERRSGPAVRAAVRLLGAIGRGAEPALPLLDAAVAGDRRHTDRRSRHPIRDDDALVHAARAAAGRIRAAA